MPDLIATVQGTGAATDVIAAPATNLRVTIKAIHISSAGTAQVFDGTTAKFSVTAGSLNLTNIEVDMTPATAVKYTGTASVTIVYRVRRIGG